MIWCGIGQIHAGNSLGIPPDPGVLIDFRCQAVMGKGKQAHRRSIDPFQPPGRESIMESGSPQNRIVKMRDDIGPVPVARPCMKKFAIHKDHQRFRQDRCGWIRCPPAHDKAIVIHTGGVDGTGERGGIDTKLFPFGGADGAISVERVGGGPPLGYADYGLCGRIFSQRIDFNGVPIRLED